MKEMRVGRPIYQSRGVILLLHRIPRSGLVPLRPCRPVHGATGHDARGRADEGTLGCTFVRGLAYTLSRAATLTRAKKLPREGCPKTCDATAPFSVQRARHHVPPFARSVPVCQSSGDAKRAVRRGQPQERLASDDGPGTAALLSGHQRDPNGTGAAALPLPLQGPASWGQKRVPSGGVRPRGPSSASRVA